MFKRIISVVCTLAMLAGICSVGVTAVADWVSFSLEAHPVTDGDTSVTVDVVVTLPVNADGYDLGAFFLLIDYDRDRMSVSESSEFLVKGTCMFSEDFSEHPFKVLWVSVKEREQFSPGSTVVSRLIFDLNEPAKAGEKFEFGVSTDPSEGVTSMESKDGSKVQTRYSDEQLIFTGASVEVLPSCDAYFLLEAHPASVGDTEITAEVAVILPEDADEYSLGSFGLEVSYDPAVMAPAGEADWKIGGNCMSSTGNSSVPYRLLWVSIDPADGFASGKTVIAQITFNLNVPAEAGTEYTIDLATDTRNGVWTMPANGGAKPAVPCNAVAVGDVVAAVENIPYGDANSDESVNLSDVTVVLQQIAKWENVNINLDAADVNVDGVINLSDVTLLLQYIAKWDGIVLGY